LQLIANHRTTPAPSQHSELADIVKRAASRIAGINDNAGQVARQMVSDFEAALRQAPCARIDALERAREIVCSVHCRMVHPNEHEDVYHAYVRGDFDESFAVQSALAALASIDKVE